MLYDRWRQIAHANPNETAIHDTATGRRWSFQQLADEAERDGVADGPIVFPQGISGEFILAVLRAWQRGSVVCPLEIGQAAPMIANMPRGIVHLKMTSATTGLPQLVAFSAEQLAADAENIVTTMGLRAGWLNLGVISLAHSYGFSNLVLPLLLHGIPLILVKAPLPEAVRQAAASAKHITLPAVPAMWRAWHQADAIPPNTRLAISAGAPLPLALEQEVFTKCGLKIHNFYGASECGGIAYDRSSGPRTDAAFVGTPMHGVQLSVAEDGCLTVRSRAVAESYLHRLDDRLQPGCFQTSDLAELVEGKVFLRGRANDQINVAGRKISPESIERTLLKHPQVRECLVFGIPSRDSERTEEIVAVLVGSVKEDVLRQFALESIPAWQLPRHWWFVEALQANPRGKVSRKEWQRKFLGRPCFPAPLHAEEQNADDKHR